MATHAQLTANRRNARKSTGPKTEAGKHRSSKNAVKHGLLAAIVPVETEEEAASPNATPTARQPGPSMSGEQPGELPGDGLPLTEWERQMQQTREWLAELGFVSQ